MGSPGAVIVVGAFLLLMACFGLTPAVSADSGSVAAPKYMQVPVYYLTDRQQKGDTYGSKRKYIVNCRHDMFYGTAFVTVLNKKDKLLDGNVVRLGWTVPEKKGEKISRKDGIDSSDPERAKREFLNRLAKAMDLAGKNVLCIFLHGASEGFEDAASDAAELEYSIQKPVILYSWPSVPKLLSYSTDNGNNEWSQGHFDMFCKDLLAFRATHPVKVILVSHSMGNRLVTRAAHLLAGTQLVEDVELVSPDIDAETFKHYVMGLRKPEEQAQLQARLYVSRKDKMLPLSQMLFGGYYRLGEGVDPVLADKENPSNHKLMQRIDFTAVDEGFSGHSIPFELISNMVSTGGPGQGYKLVAFPSEEGSRLDRFMGRWHHMGKITVGSDSGVWQRVVPAEN